MEFADTSGGALDTEPVLRKVRKTAWGTFVPRNNVSNSRGVDGLILRDFPKIELRMDRRSCLSIYLLLQFAERSIDIWHCPRHCEGTLRCQRTERRRQATQ